MADLSGVLANCWCCSFSASSQSWFRMCHFALYLWNNVYSYLTFCFHYIETILLRFNRNSTISAKLTCYLNLPSRLYTKFCDLVSWHAFCIRNNLKLWPYFIHLFWRFLQFKQFWLSCVLYKRNVGGSCRYCNNSCGSWQTYNQICYNLVRKKYIRNAYSFGWILFFNLDHSLVDVWHSGLIGGYWRNLIPVSWFYFGEA
jgi:hypothetical protein